LSGKGIPCALTLLRKNGSCCLPTKRLARGVHRGKDTDQEIETLRGGVTSSIPAAVLILVKTLKRKMKKEGTTTKGKREDRST